MHEYMYCVVVSYYVHQVRSGNLILPGKPLAKGYFVAPRFKIRDVQFIQASRNNKTKHYPMVTISVDQL